MMNLCTSCRHLINLIRSAFDQGFPVCLYDFKYAAQTKRAVAYAFTDPGLKSRGL